jgi:cell division protein FtsW
MIGSRWLRVQLWLLVACLCAFGLVMIGSTTAFGKDGGITYSFLIKQAAAMLAGAFAAMTVSYLGTDFLRHRWTVLTVVAAAVGSLLVVQAVGREINGAKRWIDLGPINLQPAEIAKLALILGAAWYLTQVAERVRSIWHGIILTMAGFMLLAGLVYATKDLGSVVVMFTVLLAMLVFAGAKWWYLLGVVGLCLPTLVLVTIINVAYRRDRMLAFLDPWNADGPAGYHLQQSLIAIGSGGLHGVGLGQSTAKLSFLPEKHTDFIFAIICEELGFIGACVVAAAFLALVMTGLMIAARARERHLRLLAIGVTIALGTQAFWNMLVPTAAVPTKGLTLPFISYGGSSVAISLLLVGILDAVARAGASATTTSIEHVTTRIGAGIRTVPQLKTRRGEA